jgi:perosamine synthetase
MRMSNAEARGVARIARYLRARGDDASLHGLGAVGELEARLRAWYGAPYAACMSSATAGLEALAYALELPSTSEFITTELTWGGAVGPWLRHGLVPRFGDVDASTLTLAPTSVRRLVTTRTKLLLVPDYLGYPADTQRFRALADEFGLWYIADVAHGFGATRCGVPSGSLADALVVSFGHGKPLWAGEGGAVVTTNRDIYEKVLWWTQHPARQIRELGPSLRNEFGTNARIHPLAALWLAETFDGQLRELRALQAKLAHLVHLLAETEVAEEMATAPRELTPAGTYLLAQRRRSVTERELQKLLLDLDAPAARTLPTIRITADAAFQAQFGHLAPTSLMRTRDLGRYFCVPLAERQRRPHFVPTGRTSRTYDRSA